MGTPDAPIRRVLDVLADLVPRPVGDAARTTIPLDSFEWLGFDALNFFADISEPGPDGRLPMPACVGASEEYVERLQALSQVRRTPIYAGWLWIAGQLTDAEGRSIKYFEPLVYTRVTLDIDVRGRQVLVSSHEVELTPRIADPAVRTQFEARMEQYGDAFPGPFPYVESDDLSRYTSLREDSSVARFGRDVARVCGFEVDRFLSSGEAPESLIDRDGVVLVAGVGTFLPEAVAFDFGRAGSLRTWAASAAGSPEWTAVHSLYLGAPIPESASDAAVDSPFALTPQQQAAVIDSRSAPVTVVSGAPGNGKSQTIAAIACDAILRGESVLVAAKTDATVDALIGLLERMPTPVPVVFGSSERRKQLAQLLADGANDRVPERAVRAAKADLSRAVGMRDGLRAECANILSVLGAEVRTDDEAWARSIAPGFFDPGVVAQEIAQLLTRAGAATTGWWARRRARRARAALLQRARAEAATPVEYLDTAWQIASASNHRADLIASGVAGVGDLWALLAGAEERVRTSLAELMRRDASSAARLTWTSSAEVAAVASALRSGRASRRRQLASLDIGKLATALPLWIGTLADIDDLLPADAAGFDLVLIDEASSVEQSLAASALLRGKRAIVVGDPRQLRQVSFVSDDDVRSATRTHGITDPTLEAKLNVRNNSVFDIAAAAAPVRLLDEHFRSAPHLMQWVAANLYDGRVHVATRTPATARRDCIHCQRVDGARDERGVVVEEVDAVVEILRRQLEDVHTPNVGVITPFRAQADAIEEAVLARFRSDEIVAMDLRIGTAHAFQGNERDTMIVSVGAGAGAPSGTWRFINDEHLLAVLLTRARRDLVVVTAADAPEGSLFASYMNEVDNPRDVQNEAHSIDEWTDGIARALEDSGVETTVGYRTGRHVLDLCVGDAKGFLAVETRVHPDGIEAHIDRHLALMGTGWKVIEAWQPVWGEARGELVVQLLGALANREA